MRLNISLNQFHRNWIHGDSSRAVHHSASLDGLAVDTWKRFGSFGRIDALAFYVWSLRLQVKLTLVGQDGCLSSAGHDGLLMLQVGLCRESETAIEEGALYAESRAANCRSQKCSSSAKVAGKVANGQFPISSAGGNDTASWLAGLHMKLEGAIIFTIG